MKNYLVIIFLLITQLAFSQLKTVTFSELETLQKTHSKPVVIRFYTDWCAVCKVEFHQLNKNRDIVKMLNEQFYFISFEAEKTREDLTFQEKTFRYLPNGNSGIHELALAFSRNKNQPVYPLWIILDKDLKLINYHEGKYAVPDLQRDLEMISAKIN